MRTSNETRSELNRLLAKAIAFHDCNRDDLARQAVSQLVANLSTLVGGCDAPLTFEIRA